jgi:hypothetical protein
LIDRAVRTYFRSARRINHVPEQASLPCCEVRHGKVILANTHRMLAAYRVGKDRLVRVQRPAV